jgi:hypothetical protein
MRGHRGQASASRRHLPAYHGTTLGGRVDTRDDAGLPNLRSGSEVKFGGPGGAELGSFCHGDWVRSSVRNWVRFVTRDWVRFVTRDWVRSAIWNRGSPGMRCTRPVFNQLHGLRSSASIGGHASAFSEAGIKGPAYGRFHPTELGSFRSTGSPLARSSSLRIAGGGPGARWPDRFGGRGARWISRLTVARGGPGIAERCA